MGAWGAGGFANDTALDFASSIRTFDDIAAVFDPAPDIEIDADTACTVIAAAECIAALLGRPGDDLPEDPEERLGTFGKPDAGLLESARNHLSAAISRSELGELWAESGEASQFNLAMTDLIDRLNPASPARKKKSRAKKPQFNPSPCAFCNQPMDEEAFGMFEISLDPGTGYPMQLGKWAHLACLNTHLHPTHIVQPWKFDPAATGAGAERRPDDDESGA